MDCSARQTIVEYRQLHKNVLDEQLADLNSDILELGTTRDEKRTELGELEKEITTKATELGKTRDDIKKARKSLFGVIGGFGGMVGMVLVIVAVVFYIRYRKSRPRAPQPVDTWEQPTVKEQSDGKNENLPRGTPIQRKKNFAPKPKNRPTEKPTVSPLNLSAVSREPDFEQKRKRGNREISPSIRQRMNIFGETS